MTTSRVEGLTPAERQALVLVSDGCTKVQVARVLQKSPATVKSQLGHAARRNGAVSMAHLVAMAIRRGWIE